MSTRFGQDFEVEVQASFEAGAWASFFCWCFVEVIKLNLGRDSDDSLVKIFKLKFYGEVDVWSRF